MAGLDDLTEHLLALYRNRGTQPRRKDVQVPLLTDAASYQRVAHRIPTVLEEHGRAVRRAPPPWWLTAPLRVLGAMDHDAFQTRIPADLAYFEGRELVLALYPSGLLIRGRQCALASAQGLIVEGVSDLDVWQTSDPRAQEIERRIARLWHTARGDGAARTGPAPTAGRSPERSRPFPSSTTSGRSSIARLSS